MKNLLILLCLIPTISWAQQDTPLTFYISKDSSAYLTASALGQVWLRYNVNNPGSMAFTNEIENTFDIGLRRWRVQLSGHLSPKVFYYTQFGQNNFQSRSTRRIGAFFHDAFLEYHLLKQSKLTLGAGLSSWNGLSRYASPSVGSLLALDAPLYQQTTNGINDQFLRKLSIHTKGIIGKLNYRLMMTTPMALQQTSPKFSALKIDTASYSLENANLQYQGYLMWHFKETESNQLPFNTGTYLGQQSVINLGFGFHYQKDALWSTNTSQDTSFHHMIGFGIDFFLDQPLNKKTALTWYSAYHYFDYGPNFSRSFGVMNPSNNSSRTDVFAGPGNAYVQQGTGHSFYTQVGYLVKDLNTEGAAIQPYFTSHFAKYEALNDLMSVFDLGINYLIHGTHKSKISLNIQNRPIFITRSDGSHHSEQRANMYVIQYQLSF